MIHVCHVMSADLWAGAEAQVAASIAELVREPTLRVSAVLFNDGPLARALTRLRVPVSILDEAQQGPMAMATSLARSIDDQAVDIVHTHRHSDTVIGTAAAVLAGRPRVVRTVHGLREPMRGWAGARYRAYETLERMALRWRADALVAVSRDIAAHLRAGFEPTRVTQIYNGIDPDLSPRRCREAVRRELGIGHDTLVVGTAGRLTPVKRQAALLRAVRLVRDRGVDLRCVIVGDGPLRNELSAEAAALDIADACVFTGAREDVHDLVAAMDLFALPSLHEGIPMAMLEAMALGVPVVATRVGGMPEVIDDDRNGVLVEAGDDVALADACAALAADPGRRARLARHARAVVRESFSAPRAARALVATYGRVMEEPPRRGVSHVVGPCCGAALGAIESRTRRASHSLERLRARRARARHAAALDHVLPQARCVLVVCHGNIIRSAFAARLLEARRGSMRVPEIDSAGVAGITGKPAHHRAVVAAAARGIDLGSHAAKRLDAAAVAAADVIFVMDVSHVRAIRQQFPAAAGKCFLLTTLDADAPLEIDDPYFGDQAMFDRCFDVIARAVDTIARRFPSPSACS